MKRYLTWLGLGLLGAAVSGPTFACSSSDSGGGGSSGGGAGGSGGSIVGGSGGMGGSVGGSGGAVGGAGGSGGSATSTKLGAKCTKDADCGAAGVICLKADSTEFSGEGPAGGYCTADCSTGNEENKICGPLGGVCLGYGEGQKAYCMRSCEFGQVDGSKKCLNRPEVACSGLIANAAGAACDPTKADSCPTGETCYSGDSKCHKIIPACLPTCGNDKDCGGSLKCNPQTGRCTSKALSGKDYGEACVPKDAGAPDCKGICLGFGDNLRQCSGLCTVNGGLNCGETDPNAPAKATCMWLGGKGYDTGDQGYCGALCDCNSQCAAGFICQDFGNDANGKSWKDGTHREGYCKSPKNSEGGVDTGIATCKTDGGGTGGTGGGDASTD